MHVETNWPGSEKKRQKKKSLEPGIISCIQFEKVFNPFL